MAKAADSCLTELYEYALPPWDLPMSNLQNRIYTHYLAVKQLLISRKWAKSGLGIALAILVITALISAIGSQVDTQAASGPGLANERLGHSVTNLQQCISGVSGVGCSAVENIAAGQRIKRLTDGGFRKFTLELSMT